MQKKYYWYKFCSKMKLLPTKLKDFAIYNLRVLAFADYPFDFLLIIFFMY